MSRKNEERMMQIVNLLKEKKDMKVADLASHFQVTPETIRKNLDVLQEKGEVVRSHGSVRAVQSAGEVPIEIRKDKNRADKQRVAYRVIQEIQDGMTVYLDAGSTLLSGIDMLKSKKDLTVVVNAIPVAMEVLQMGFHVIFLGGAIESRGMRTEGYFAEEMLDKIHLDLAILGTCGIQNANGFGVYRDVEIGSRRKILEKADRTILIMDSTKFDQCVNFKFCDFSEVSSLITNPLNNEQRKSLQAIPEIIEV